MLGHQLDSGNDSNTSITAPKSLTAVPASSLSAIAALSASSTSLSSPVLLFPTVLLPQARSYDNLTQLAAGLPVALSPHAVAQRMFPANASTNATTGTAMSPVNFNSAVLVDAASMHAPYLRGSSLALQMPSNCEHVKVYSSTINVTIL